MAGTSPLFAGTDEPSQGFLLHLCLPFTKNRAELRSRCAVPPRVSQDPVEILQIFFIEHYPEHRLWSESGGILASRLFAQLFLPRWNDGIVESGATVCEQLLQKVQCQKLGFAKHPSVIDFVRQVKPGGRK